ncbi:MAG: nucleotide-binding protein, partial [bacterium]
MSAITDKKGRALLGAIIDELRRLDPRIVPFDSDEVTDLETGVSQAVKDFFGSGSPEYAEFENFHIAAGHITRGDSRTEKQSKYEMGLPKAIARLEELAELMDRVRGMEEKVPDLAPEDLVEIGEAASPGQPSSSPKAPPARKPPPPAEPKAQPKPRAAPAPEAKPSVKPAGDQPGGILLLQSGGDEIPTAVTALMKKIGIKVATLDEMGQPGMESISVIKDVAFALLTASFGQKGGLSGLTSVIAKPRPKHEIAFKLGMLVGRLGAGKVAILHSGERPQDIPEDLFGVRYIPYQEDGGWQIVL